MGADRRRLGALQVLAGAAAIALLVALASGQLGHLPNRETSVLARGEHVAEVSRVATTAADDAAPGSDQGAATRVLVEDSEWGRSAERALRKWRSSLFRRMATQYKELERNKTEGGTKDIARFEPFQLSRYDLFNPFLTCSGGQLKRLGNKGDGGKWICLDDYLQQPGCIIYSLGSRGWFDFEEAMLEATPCEIYTFDCTYNGSALAKSGGRHHYHKICVGQPTSAFAQVTPDMFKTYDAIMASLNHKRVDLLKIDIEGFEYDTLGAWEPSCQLPMQIAMEVHYQYLYGNEKKPKNFANLFWSMHQLSLGELAVWFGHFADLGYGVVSREDNLPYGIGCCAEFTFVKVERPATC